MIFDTSFVVKSASLASSTTKGGDDGEGGVRAWERETGLEKKKVPYLFPPSSWTPPAL